MKTQLSTFPPKSPFRHFIHSGISKDALIHIKGGDGGNPPDDGEGVIGVEDIVTG